MVKLLRLKSGNEIWLNEAFVMRLCEDEVYDEETESILTGTSVEMSSGSRYLVRGTPSEVAALLTPAGV